tara:strand:- start:2 stop:268 length:267 start_codon:yes stop_codon:yes gene_type:complete
MTPSTKQKGSKMKSHYLSEYEIQQMAEAALTSYEFTASWSRAFEAAADHCADEWCIQPTKAQCATAVNIAKTGWEGIKASVKQVVYYS